MLTVNNLVKYTRSFHSNVIRNARRVITRVTDVEGDPEDPKYRKVELVAKGDTVPRYITMMFWGPFTPSAKVWVSCTCPYFKYTNEVALEKQGSSDINFSNGKYPKITNPRAIPGACKHIMAALMNRAYEEKPPPPSKRKKDKREKVDKRKERRLKRRELRRPPRERRTETKESKETEETKDEKG